MIICQRMKSQQMCPLVHYCWWNVLSFLAYHLKSHPSRFGRCSQLWKGLFAHLAIKHLDSFCLSTSERSCLARWVLWNSLLSHWFGSWYCDIFLQITYRPVSHGSSCHYEKNHGSSNHMVRDVVGMSILFLIHRKKSLSTFWKEWVVGVVIPWFPPQLPLLLPFQRHLSLQLT